MWTRFNRLPIAVQCVVLICITALILMAMHCFHHRHIINTSDSYGVFTVHRYNRWTGEMQSRMLFSDNGKDVLSVIDD